MIGIPEIENWRSGQTRYVENLSNLKHLIDEAVMDTRLEVS